MSRDELAANAIVYTYPNGDTDLVCASDRMFTGPGWEAVGPGETRAVPRPREAGVKSHGADQLRSMRRARANLRRLALSNEFDYFVTLTLAPDRIDRYDGGAVVKALNRWADNMVRRHGLKYILVPELHQDGAFHFHGFLRGAGLQVVDSGVQWDGRPVYNLPQWTLGFSTAQRLYGEYSRAVAYCCKYVGKQEGERPLGRWYYSGGGLAQPHKDYLALDYRATVEEYVGQGVELEIPGSRLFVARIQSDNSD